MTFRTKELFGVYCTHDRSNPPEDWTCAEPIWDSFDMASEHAKQLAERGWEHVEIRRLVVSENRS